MIEQHIRILGYPGLGGDTLTETRGIVSGFDENRNLKTDAEINPGNSGGGAFNDAGEFLGIPSFIMADGSGKIGFIISIERIKDWLQAILKDGTPPTLDTISLTLAAPDLRFSGGE